MKKRSINNSVINLKPSGSGQTFKCSLAALLSYICDITLLFACKQAPS